MPFNCMTLEHIDIHTRLHRGLFAENCDPDPMLSARPQPRLCKREPPQSNSSSTLPDQLLPPLAFVFSLQPDIQIFAALLLLLSFHAKIGAVVICKSVERKLKCQLWMTYFWETWFFFWMLLSHVYMFEQQLCMCIIHPLIRSQSNGKILQKSISAQIMRVQIFCNGVGMT